MIDMAVTSFVVAALGAAVWAEAWVVIMTVATSPPAPHAGTIGTSGGAGTRG